MPSQSSTADVNNPKISCITVQDITRETRFLYATWSVMEVLGYEPHELIGTSAFDIIHPLERDMAMDAFYDALRSDRAAVVGYLRFQHKDGTFLPCRATWTVATNCIISGIEVTPEDPIAPSNNPRTSTAQEVMVFTPHPETGYVIKTSWNRERDARPPHRGRHPPRVEDLPPRSVRQALILDRFSHNCSILFCSVGPILDARSVPGRSFYDFVAQGDEAMVRSWINRAKANAVGTGPSADTAFAYGTFDICPAGRKSKAPVSPESCSLGAELQLDDDGETAGSDGLRLLAPKPTVAETRTTMDAILDTNSDGIIVILRHSTTTNTAANANDS